MFPLKRWPGPMTMELMVAYLTVFPCNLIEPGGEDDFVPPKADCVVEIHEPIKRRLHVMKLRPIVTG